MEIKYLANPTFDVWGEKGTKNRFLRFHHPELPSSVILLLSETQIQDLHRILQAELPPEAYTTTHQTQ